METFDELNNVGISSNIYKILECIYERKKEYDEIKSNLNEMNSTFNDINHDPKHFIESINEKLNTIYLDISSNMFSTNQERIQEISTIRLNNNEFYPENKKDTPIKLNDFTSVKEKLINQNLPEFNKSSFNNIRNFNENIKLDKDSPNNFNTIKSNNKNTINLNDETNLNIVNKLISTNKKQDTLEHDNHCGFLDNFGNKNYNNKNEGKKYYSSQIGNTNNCDKISSNIKYDHIQDDLNNINNLGLIREANQKEIDDKQYTLKRSLSKEKSANKVNNYFSNKKLNFEGNVNENIIKNMPSQIVDYSDELNITSKKNTNNPILNDNNLISNGFNPGYSNNNNNFTEFSNQKNYVNNFANQQEAKRIIYKTTNSFNDTIGNPKFNYNEQRDENSNNLIINRHLINNEKNISSNDATNNNNKDYLNNTNKFIVSLKENTNLLFVYNTVSKLKFNIEVNFPLDSKDTKFNWNCRLYQKESNIFITGGHNDNNIPSKKCLYLNTNIFDYLENNNYNQNKINITELKPMNFSRWAHSLILVRGRFLFCISGYNNKKCEFLDTQNNKWKNISELNIWRMDPNLFIFNNSYLYVFGGFNDNNKFQKPFVKKIEKLKLFTKGVEIPSNINKWEFVNILDDKGEMNLNYLIPSMGIISISENKLLLVGGDTSDYSNFYEENNSNRNYNYNLNGNIDENNYDHGTKIINKNNNKLQYHNDIYLVKINFLGNCEISHYNFKLNNPCCFTTSKSFINQIDAFYCFDHSLELCEIKTDLLNIQ